LSGTHPLQIGSSGFGLTGLSEYPLPIIFLWFGKAGLCMNEKMSEKVYLFWVLLR